MARDEARRIGVATDELGVLSVQSRWNALRVVGGKTTVAAVDNYVEDRDLAGLPVADWYNDSYVYVLSGPNKGVSRKISGYVVASGRITTESFPHNFVVGDCFVVNSEPYLLDKVDEILGFLEANIQLMITPLGVSQIDVDGRAMFLMGLADKDTGDVPVADITPGTYDIQRSSGGGAWASVASGVLSAADGRVFVDYVFAAASWSLDDHFYVEFRNTVVDIGGNLYYVPQQVWHGLVVDFSAIYDQITSTIASHVVERSTVQSELQSKLVSHAGVSGENHSLTQSEIASHVVERSTAQSELQSKLVSHALADGVDHDLTQSEIASHVLQRSIGDSELQSKLVSHALAVQGATFDTSTDSLEAVRNSADAGYTDVTSMVASHVVERSTVQSELQSKLVSHAGVSGENHGLTQSEIASHVVERSTAQSELQSKLVSHALADGVDHDLTQSEIASHVLQRSIGDSELQSKLVSHALAVQGATFDTSTDSLEALRRGGETVRGLVGAPRNVWHVDGGIAASGDGKSWETAFKTIEEATNSIKNTSLVAGDVVLVRPGDYDEDANAGGVVVNVDNVVVLGANTHDLDDKVRVENTIVGGTGVFAISGSGVVVEGLSVNESLGRANAMVVTGNNCHLENMLFGQKVDISGVRNRIENCSFELVMSSGLVLGGARNTIKKCVFRGVITGENVVEATSFYNRIEGCVFTFSEPSSGNIILFNATDATSNIVLGCVFKSGSIGVRCEDNKMCIIDGNTFFDLTIGVSLDVDTSKILVCNNAGDGANLVDDMGTDNISVNNVVASKILSTNTIQEDIKAVFDNTTDVESMVASHVVERSTAQSELQSKMVSHAVYVDEQLSIIRSSVEV